MLRSLDVLWLLYGAFVVWAIGWCVGQIHRGWE